MLTALRLGFAGAYAYTILTLGQRNFQRDITSGVAIGSAVTLAFGPVLAGVIASVWHGPKEADISWEIGTVYFLAGLAPRYVGFEGLPHVAIEATGGNVAKDRDFLVFVPLAKDAAFALFDLGRLPGGIEVMQRH